jgi:hypothetical protein
MDSNTAIGRRHVRNSLRETVKLPGLPFEIVSAGDHCDLKISKQMLPFELMFG